MFISWETGSRLKHATHNCEDWSSDPQIPYNIWEDMAESIPFSPWEAETEIPGATWLHRAVEVKLCSHRETKESREPLRKTPNINFGSLYAYMSMHAHRHPHHACIMDVKLKLGALIYGIMAIDKTVFFAGNLVKGIFSIFFPSNLTLSHLVMNVLVNLIVVISAP